MAAITTKKSVLIDGNGDPFIDRQDILNLALQESERITYADGPVSKPNFKKVVLDGQWTGYVRCFRCQNVQIQKYNPKHGNMLTHNQRNHPEMLEEDRKLIRNAANYVQVPEEVTQQRLEAASNFWKSDPEPDRYMFCFAPTDNFRKGRQVFICCYCNHESCKSVSSMKGHLNHICPGVPDNVRDEVKNSKAKSGPRRKRRWKKRPSNYDSDEEDGLNEDFDTFSNDGSLADGQDNGEGDLGDGNEAEKAVKILSKLLCQPKVSNHVQQAKVAINPSSSQLVFQRELERSSTDMGTTVQDVEKQFKMLEAKKLKLEMEESELRIKREEIKLKVKSLELKEKVSKEKVRNEKIKLFQSINSRMDKICNIADNVLAGTSLVNGHGIGNHL